MQGIGQNTGEYAVMHKDAGGAKTRWIYDEVMQNYS